MENLEKFAENADLCRLSSASDYQNYFNILRRAFTLMITWYKKLVEGGNVEAEIVQSFLERMLYTVNQLRLKQAQRQPLPLALDLNDSGFPHWVEISGLEADLALQPSRLQALPSERVLKEMMLSEMLENGQDPEHLLSEMGEVEYLLSLDGEQLIRPFTAGELNVVEVAGDLTRGLFSWLCYDGTDNVPYVHIMGFDYDGTTEQLKAESGEFLTVVRRYGDRAAPMIVLATSIDEALPRVFPKFIKRLKIGPIMSAQFPALKEGEYALLDGQLREFGQPGDFIARWKAEAIFSKGEYAEKTGWFARQVRQIFAIPQGDQLCVDHMASQVERMLLLPHSLLQIVGQKPEFREAYGQHHFITYDLEGGIYAS